MEHRTEYILILILILVIGIKISQRIYRYQQYSTFYTEKPNMIAPDSSYYNEIGIIISEDFGEKAIILPLYGRKINNSRWEYFSKYDKWLLPVQYLNRDCQTNIGCDKIYNGAEVIIPEYANKLFIVKLR